MRVTTQIGLIKLISFHQSLNRKASKNVKYYFIATLFLSYAYLS